MPIDQNSAQFLDQLKTAARGFLSWLGEEGREPEHPPVPARASAPDQAPASGKAPARHAAGSMLVTPDGKALFVRRAAGDHQGTWALPGGMAKGDETPEQTAMRETREEVGADNGMGPRGLKKLGTNNRTGVNYTTFAHPVKTAFTPVLNHEHDAHQWASLTNPPKPLHPGVADTIQQLAAMAKGRDAGSPTTPSPVSTQGTSGGGVKGAGSSDTSLNRPASLEAGSFRDPHLTEAGNSRVPVRDARAGARSGWRSPTFDQPPVFAREVNTRRHMPQRTPMATRTPQGTPMATDPLTSKGSKIMSAMKDQYGAEKGEQVFYASKNKGNISGVDNRPMATDPPVSEAQRRAMRAAAGGKSNLGIPQSVGEEFSQADPGGKLPATKDQAGSISADPIQANALKPSPLKPPALNPPTMTPRGADQPQLRGSVGQGVAQGVAPGMAAAIDPDRAYHVSQFKGKENLYKQMKGQRVPMAFADKHRKDLDNLQKQMLAHAQAGGFAHGSGGEGDAGMVDGAEGNWASPTFPPAEQPMGQQPMAMGQQPQQMDAGTSEGARKAAATRAGGGGTAPSAPPAPPRVPGSWRPEAPAATPAARLGRAAGRALEQAHPWGYRSGESEP